MSLPLQLVREAYLRQQISFALAFERC